MAWWWAGGQQGPWQPQGPGPGQGPGGGQQGPNLEALAAALLLGSQQTQQAVQQLAETLRQSEEARVQNQGYRSLKPKREITGITAESAKVLLLEMVQFTIDLGELGIAPFSEAGYRQLRACVTGRAKDTVDLFLAHGEGLQACQLQEQARQNREGQVRCDQIGGWLYGHIVGELESSVHLTNDRRTQIASEVYAEAKCTKTQHVKQNSFWAGIVEEDT